MSESAAPILSIKDLHVRFRMGQQSVQAVEGLDFVLEKGKTIGVVGESGSGKSVTALSIMGLLARNGEINQGSITYQPAEGASLTLNQLADRELRKIRGREIGMIFQEPMTSLNPVFRCGEQVAEALRLHLKLDKKTARARTLELFRQVELPRVEEMYRAYPHEISGGQKQRVMIAMALSCEPRILIADEPTTALDVTVQQHILKLLAQLKQERSLSMLFITHDLGVVADIADEVLVMYQGKAVEYGPMEKVFAQPAHPYTKGLLACRPPMRKRVSRLFTVADLMSEEQEVQDINALYQSVEIKEDAYQAHLAALDSRPAIMEVSDLKKWFPQQRSFWGKASDWVKAVDGVSLSIRPGETLGLVGESGCGKTTLGRTVLRLIEPDEGVIRYDGQDVRAYDAEALRLWRKQVQIIFQDPYSSLNPRIKIGEAILEPMQVHGLGENDKSRRQEVEALLEKVGLSSAHYGRYPHEFSGGQRQRICVARALAVKPSLIVCDESVSALDVSVQAQVLNLLKSLQSEMDLTYLFISHDLSVVKFISDRILVMKEGKIVE
ncbi:MAG: ABC transporter ATP-binding protein, partial [Bacteroidota bacterium]